MSNQMLVEQVVPEPDPVFASWVSAEGLATWWWPHTTGEPDEIRQGWEDVLARLAEIHTRAESKS